MNNQNSFSDPPQIFLTTDTQASRPATGIAGKNAVSYVPFEKECGGSEIARLLRDIEETYTAARMGLNGLASGIARHDFIEAKMTRVDQCREELVAFVGQEYATRLVYNILMHEDSD